MIDVVEKLIEKYERITILTHLNPDADTIGTALGIYGIMKNSGKQVEVVNAGVNLPRYLDFLPNFNKIKNHIDFENSLIITCDTGSIDRLGFNLGNREILNIDHHTSNTYFGDVNVIDSLAVSASQVAYTLFKKSYTITTDIATCFYTALVSDTQYFTTSNIKSEIFELASEMMAYNVNISEVNLNIKQRRPLSAIRILSSTLNTLELNNDGELVIMFASKEKMHEAGADIIDMVGIVDHGIALVTAKIAILLTELDTSIRVSMRSKMIDLSSLAVAFGGGGHRNAVGFEVENIKKEELIIMIKKEIKERGLLDEK